MISLIPPLRDPQKYPMILLLMLEKGKYKKRSYYGITKVHQTKTVQHDENLY